MVKKVHLARDRHQKIGTALYKMQNALRDLQVEIGNTYSLNSKEIGLLDRAVSLMDQIRSELENRMFKEYPDAPLRTYYPGGSPQNSERKVHRWGDPQTPRAS